MENNWKEQLSPEQYRVMREKGTEVPFTGKYLHSEEKGMYVCTTCGAELFSSDTKFDFSTGWPSFTDPVNTENIDRKSVLPTLWKSNVPCSCLADILCEAFSFGQEKGLGL